MKSRKQKLKLRKAGKHFLPSVFCLLILGAGCGNLSRVRYGQETLKMAVLPAHSLEGMTGRYLPLLRHLSSETGYDVQYVSSGSYAGFGATARGSDVQLVLCDALTLLTLEKAAGAGALAVGVGPGGAISSPGLIVVRSGGVSKIGELRNKRIGLASQRSAEGFLSQSTYLMKQGIDVRRDLKLVSCGNMDEVLQMLRQGKIEAGFTGLAAWDGPEARGLEILARTEPVPNWSVAAMPGTPPEIRSKIQAALLAMNPTNESHRLVLDKIRLEGFSRPEPKGMAELARAAEAAGIPY
jgi:phosphonate transport system substrate-binding protein